MVLVTRDKHDQTSAPFVLDDLLEAVQHAFVSLVAGALASLELSVNA